MLIIICQAGLKPHPVQSILFRNLFLVGGRGSMIPLKHMEGTAFTYARGMEVEASLIREVRLNAILFF